jgi:DNA invertase Pin-like site-specific DNA recombinase
MCRVHLDPQLLPKDGKVLHVLGIDRISTRNQDPKANADQEALLHHWIADRHDGPVEWTRITGQGSGECIDREQVRQAEDLVATGKFDAVIMEDLGRHLRRAQAVDFCEQCEDANTRLIAINDGIDTAKDWRLHAFFAAMKHEQSNADTSERIKRTLRNRFLQGEVLQFAVFGYEKPPGAKHDSEMQKDPAAEAIYDKWFSILEDGGTFSDVSDWLTREGIPTGPYCRSGKWTSQMVARITRNPILKGIRERNNRKSKRVNKTGKRVSVKAAPDEKLERHCPDLAFIEPARFDRLMRILKQRNGHFKPGGDGRDPRVGRPKKRTIWPGQHIYCGVCGRLFRYGGHGQNDHLMCRGAYDYNCWNGATVDGPLAATKMATAILAKIEALPDFDDVYLAIALEELKKSNSSRAERLEAIRREELKLQRELENIVAFIREGRKYPTLHDEFERLEAARDRLAMDREVIEREPTASDSMPSLGELKQIAREAMARQADEPYEFGRIMHNLIPMIIVNPYRLCDGGRVVLRANFTLSLVSLLPPSARLNQLDEVLRHELVVDLFDKPQRTAYRQQVVEMRAQGQTEAQVAEHLGITTTAAQRAAALDRQMREMGLSDPYLLMESPPENDCKLRRHQHPRYCFEPLGNADRD